jgi:hypothetical protein
MKCIYEASSGLEAHMMFNLLQQEGIEARIDGEYLQGGAGELQAINMVRVLVDDSDYSKAQEIIRIWEATQVDKTTTAIPKSKSSGIGIGLLFGLLMGVGSTYWAYNSPIDLDGIDFNDDGKLDEKLVYKDNRISRVEVDRNLDGEVDVINKYNIKGRIYKTEADDNFDGVFESTVTYQRGNPLLQITDTDQDGTIDHRSYFNNGVLTEIEILGPTSTSPKKKQHYGMYKLISSEFDSNGDGVYDKQYSYDYYEEIK